MTAFGGLTDPTKIMGSRIGAYIVDSVIALAMLFGVLAVIGFGGSTQKIETGSIAAAQDMCFGINNGRTLDQSDDTRTCQVVGTEAWVTRGDPLARQIKYTAIYWVILALNLVLLTSFAGGSLGKLLFGLRVVRSDGSRAGLLPNLVRTVLLVVDAACCAIPGLATSFNSAGHRRIGDMAASTYVIHRSAEGYPLYIPGHLSGRGPAPAGGYAAPGGYAPAGSVADPIIPDLRAAPGGVDAPVFDQSRNAYVRFDPASGAWFQWDDRTQSWVPAAT